MQEDDVPATPIAAADPGGNRTGLVRQGAVVAVAMTFANVLGYGLSLVASRRLGPAEFGVFAAMLGLVIVGFVVSLGLQTVVTRFLAGEGSPDLGALAGTAVLASFATGAAVLLAAWPIAAFLRLPGPAPVLWAAATLVPLTWSGFVQGAAQGRERFGVLAVIVLCVTAGKVFGGLLGVLVSRSATVAVALTAVGTLAGTALATLLARSLLARPRFGAWAGGDVARASHALFALFVLTNTDLLLARHYLAPVTAGLYGAGSLITKIAFWLPQFVSVVALPRLVDPEQHGETLRRAVALLVALGVAVTAGTALLGTLVVQVVGGNAYVALAPYAWRFAALGSVLSLCQLLLYARLARGEHRVVDWIWAAVAAQVGLVGAVAHGSAQAIVTTTLGVVTVLVALGLATERRSGPASAHALDQDPAGQGPGA